jgi:hypothetical protein
MLALALFLLGAAGCSGINNPAFVNPVCGFKGLQCTTPGSSVGLHRFGGASVAARSLLTSNSAPSGKQVLGKSRLLPLPCRQSQIARKAIIGEIDEFPADDEDGSSQAISLTSIAKLWEQLSRLAEPFWGGSGRVSAWLWTAATFSLALFSTLYAVSISFVQVKHHSPHTHPMHCRVHMHAELALSCIRDSSGTR